MANNPIVPADVVIVHLLWENNIFLLILLIADDIDAIQIFIGVCSIIIKKVKSNWVFKMRIASFSNKIGKMRML